MLELTTLSFDTKKEAIEWLNNLPGYSGNERIGWSYDGMYICAHGEYERPSYFPRRYKDGWGIHAVYYFYAGTYGAPKDGRVMYYDPNYDSFLRD